MRSVNCGSHLKYKSAWGLHVTAGYCTQSDCSWSVSRDADGVWWLDLSAGGKSRRVDSRTDLCARLVIQEIERREENRAVRALSPIPEANQHSLAKADSEIEALYPIPEADLHLLDHVKTLTAQLDTWKRDYWRQAIVLAISTLAHLFFVIF